MRVYQAQPARDAASQISDFQKTDPLYRPLPGSRFPFGWWRMRDPVSFNARDLTILRKILLRTPFAAEPDWHRAITGDAATAIGIAAHQMLSRSIAAPEIDLSVTAVLACALESDAASRVLISSALRRRAKIDPTCKCLSEKWLGRRL